MFYRYKNERAKNNVKEIASIILARRNFKHFSNEDSQKHYNTLEKVYEKILQ